MDFFEKLNNLLTEAGKEVEQRAKEVSETMRLNTRIREEKAAIKGCMEKIGRLYYEEQKGNGQGIYQDSFDRIHKAKEVIRRAEKELEVQKRKTTCQNCGATMQRDDIFCSQCGTKREDPIYDAEETDETEQDAENQETDAAEIFEEPQEATEDEAECINTNHTKETTEE